MSREHIPNWVNKRAYLTPEKPGIIYQDVQYSFKTIYDEALKIADQLASMNVARGQYIAVLLKNHIDSAMILYALQMVGVKAVILNNRLTADEIAWQLEHSEAFKLITEDSFRAMEKELKTIGVRTPVIFKDELFVLECCERAEILEEYPLDEVTTIMYTSGTTGFPKGVQQTYGNHWWSAVGSMLNLGLQEEDRWLCNVPIFHISGYSILMRSMIYGTPVILQDGFNAEHVIQMIEKHRVTIMSAVSTMVARLVETLDERRLPAFFRGILLGGGPASKALLHSCIEKGIQIFQTYGMTETASQSATLSHEDAIRKLGSAGKPLFPVQIKIVGHEGQELSEDHHGEIVIKGPNVTCGYLNNESATAEKIRDGWLYTGDLGYFDEEGFLYVLDRRSDLIISGGENIYPAEIEGVLLHHPKIIEAGVVGVEDKIWGEVPAAFIVTALNSELNVDEVIEYCKTKLAKYKVPKHIFFTTQLPRNAAKKLLRRELREWYKNME